MPRYEALYWAERTPKGRRATYPSFKGEATADVVVIGGGLVGVTAAYVLARSGLDVVLLEGDRLATGGTARGIGAIVPEPTASLRMLESAVGAARAKAAWRTTRDSARDLTGLLRRIGVKCDLAPVPIVTPALDSAGSLQLKREYAARRSAGLDASWLAAKASQAIATPESLSGLKRRDAYLLDPVRAALGIARAAEQVGARVFERSMVRRTTHGRSGAAVHLKSGRIHTKGVFVATRTPGTLFRPLARHVRLEDAYAVVTEPLSLPMRRAAGSHDIVSPNLAGDRWLRWLSDRRALFAGSAGPVSTIRATERVLVQRAGQLMYELSLRYPMLSGLPGRWGWRFEVATSSDGLPWIGPHRNYPAHFFALAPGWTGDALAYFAARTAARYFNREAVRGDDVFGFGR